MIFFYKRVANSNSYSIIIKNSFMLIYSKKTMLRPYSNDSFMQLMYYLMQKLFTSLF